MTRVIKTKNFIGNSNVNVDHTSVQNIKQYHQTDLIMQQLKEEREYRDRTERRIQELK